MSKRRSISFKKNEDDLLNFFDENGKGDIAKESMRFYKNNKDKVLTDGMINILKHILGKEKQNTFND